MQRTELPSVNDADLQLSDQELVNRAKNGDLSAFETLVSRYEQRVFNLAMRMLHNVHDAEDVTQQTFLNALEHLEEFRGDASFATWLYRIATNAALKNLRKKRGLPTVSLEESTELQEERDTIPHPEYLADWRQSPQELIQNNEVRALIQQALDELDEKHRLVFLLRDVEGLSVKETAQALGISEANVKVRLLRARLQLREKLTRTFGDPKTLVKPEHKHKNSEPRA